ncbi:MAG TPA: hypothetical protein VE398_08000, partial [Acidobacteriota bacterium]|nr:hypothetical protein [Acidobacteriota bacterium]
MTKSLMIRPDAMRASGQVEFNPVPVNRYSRTLREELAKYSRRDLLRLFRDMAIIRNFESMLNE